MKWLEVLQIYFDPKSCKWRPTIFLSLMEKLEKLLSIWPAHEYSIRFFTVTPEPLKIWHQSKFYDISILDLFVRVWICHDHFVWVFISFMEKEWILSFLWILSALPPVDLFPLSWLHFQRLIWTWPKLSSCSGLSEGEITPSPLERGRGIQLFWLHSLHMPNKISS